MRWFIVFLIVANVILFFWVQQQSRSLTGESALPPPDIGRLRLSNELEKEQGSASPASQVPSTGEQFTAQPADSSLPGEAEAEAKAEAKAEVVVAPAEPLPDPSADLVGAPSVPVVTEVVPESDVSPPQSSTQPTAEVVQADVVDMDDPVDTVAAAEQSVAQAREADAEIAGSEPEVPGGAGEEKAEEPLTGSEPTGNDSPVAVCARVGPFEPEDADRLLSKMPANLQLLSDVSEEYASVDRYYVLIPALPSRAAGRRKLKELAAAGFTDTWLFPSGRYRNAISLGYFSREGRARRHAASIARKGFVTEVQEKTSVRQRRWLLLKKTDAGDLGSDLPLPRGASVEPQHCP